MIFEEDEVSVENESGLQYALVIESSEFVSSDEEDEDNSYWDRVKRGTLRVAWHPDGEEEIVPESEVSVSEPYCLATNYRRVSIIATRK